MGAEILAKLHNRNMFACFLPGYWFGFVLVCWGSMKITDGLSAYRQYLAYLNKKLEKGEVEAFKADEKALAKSAEYVASLAGLRITVLFTFSVSLVNATAIQETRLIQKFRYLL